jgi:RimJ/RimL family protein N-acetyltransferase
MNISYRKLQAIDSAQYREIRLESLKAHPDSFGSDYEEQRQLPKLMFEKALEQPVDNRFIFGAFDQGELIGICGFLPFAKVNDLELSHTGTIVQMYVRSTYSGRRIGLSLVIDTLRDAFKDPQIEHIILGVKEGNMSAIRVYEQAGFQPYNAGGDEGFRMMVFHRDAGKTG